MIKTTKEIFDEYPSICYAGIEHSNKKDIDKCNNYKNKVWVDRDKLYERYRELSKRGENMSARTFLLLLGDFKDIDIGVDEE